MKKLWIALLLSLSCACVTAGAAGCDKESSESVAPPQSSFSDSVDAPSSEAPDDSSDSGREDDTSSSETEKNDETYAVHFTEGDGYKYVTEVKSGDTLAAGDVLSFTVDVGAFYTGTPVVSVNGKAVPSDNDGAYHIEMTEEITVTVAGVSKDRSSMQGTGAFDDAFVVTKPIDLLFIAEQVNAGKQAYVNGAYVLANDIDCKGEKLEIIGDSRIENAYFAGCFTCPTDAETGEMQRHTISNFTIDSDNANYVGLFGTVMVDLTVTSSGLFYGVGLDNFTINARLDDPTSAGNSTIVCGSLIGYGIGAKAYLCDATNGELNVYADDAYFAFAGGLIGYQQGVYIQAYDSYNPSEVAYAKVDVDVNVLKGAALCAGGISGYLATNYPFAPAYIHHSYSTGSVSGAIRAGGIAGGLGTNTSVSNCYATGAINARATQSATASTTTQESLEYSYATAGGLVGFAENDSIVNDSFFAGTTAATASSGNAYEQTGAIVGGGYEAGTALASAQKYVVFNCLERVTDPDDIQSVLGWKAYNWSFRNGEYPTINYDTPDMEIATLTVTKKYVSVSGEALTVNKLTQLTENYVNPATDAYATIGEAFATGGLASYYQADNGYLSYGYFFDEACTMPVPYAFLTAKDVIFYIGFADPAPVVGEYTFAVDGSTKPLTLTLDKNGKAYYTDGATTRTANYLYDGKEIVLQGSRLARYYLGDVTVDDGDETVNPYFDSARYTYYDFKAIPNADALVLYDGTYFTKASPLLAMKTALRGEFYTVDNAGNLVFYEFYGKTGVEEGDRYDGFTYTFDGTRVEITFDSGEKSTLNATDLKTYDKYKGVWTKSATVNKTYSFDGMGNWEYKYVGYNRSGYTVDEITLDRQTGTYTVNEDGTLTLSNGYTVSFTSDGHLELVGDNKTQIYYASVSYAGEWSNGNGAKLLLNGIGNADVGTALLTYTGGYEYALFYELSETENYLWLYDESGEFFGYFTYDLAYNALIASLYDPLNQTTGYTSFLLFAVDDYAGEWISNDPLFENVDFNGAGLYDLDYANMTGRITVNGQALEIKYTLENSTLNGKFVYDGNQYVLRYDEDNKVVSILYDDKVTLLERKDEFAGKEFIDADGNSYVFDGKSNLFSGGSFTMNDKTYAYKTAENGFEVLENGGAVGYIRLAKKCYELTLKGTVYELYIKNSLMGDWAIGGMYTLLKIGATTTEGKVLINFDGRDMEMTYLDTATLTFSYRNNGMPFTYYVLLFDENTITLSESTSLLDGGYYVCSRANEMYGKWISNRDPKKSISFDGVTSNYANGQAKISRLGDTLYYYTIRESGTMIWSQEPLGDRTLYYKIVMTDDATARNAYVNTETGKAFVLVEIDSLYLTQAKDADGVTYVFDGLNVGNALGTLTASNGKTYGYKVTAFNTDSTANLLLTDKETGVTYQAILDYSGDEILLVFGDVVEETENA